MSIPKRHHYLPQFYLEHFCRDGSIWIFDRDTKKYRRDGTQNTAVISHYYSAEGIEGERRADIEAMFARIEGAMQMAASTLPVSVADLAIWCAVGSAK